MNSSTAGLIVRFFSVIIATGSGYPKVTACSRVERSGMRESRISLRSIRAMFACKLTDTLKHRSVLLSDDIDQLTQQLGGRPRITKGRVPLSSRHLDPKVRERFSGTGPR
jgi:hypothetical protein